RRHPQQPVARPGESALHRVSKTLCEQSRGSGGASILRNHFPGGAGAEFWQFAFHEQRGGAPWVLDGDRHLVPPLPQCAADLIEIARYPVRRSPRFRLKWDPVHEHPAVPERSNPKRESWGNREEVERTAKDCARGCCLVWQQVHGLVGFDPMCSRRVEENGGILGRIHAIEFPSADRNHGEQGRESDQKTTHDTPLSCPSSTTGAWCERVRRSPSAENN